MHGSLSRAREEEKSYLSSPHRLHTSDKIAFRMNGDLDIRVVDCQIEPSRALSMYERHLFFNKVACCENLSTFLFLVKNWLCDRISLPPDHRRGCSCNPLCRSLFRSGFSQPTRFHIDWSGPEASRRGRFDVILLSQHATDAEFAFLSPFSFSFSASRGEHIHTSAQKDKSNLLETNTRIASA